MLGEWCRELMIFAVIDRTVAYMEKGGDTTSEWPTDMITEAYQIAKRLNLHTPVCEQYAPEEQGGE